MTMAKYNGIVHVEIIIFLCMDNGAIYQKGIVVHLLIVTASASPAAFLLLQKWSCVVEKIYVCIFLPTKKIIMYFVAMHYTFGWTVHKLVMEKEPQM